MHKGVLRKVGGSVVVSLPPAFLDQLELDAGSAVGMAVQDGSIVIRPQERPRYRLAELIAACDVDAPAPEEDQDWASGLPQGRELI